MDSEGGLWVKTVRVDCKGRLWGRTKGRLRKDCEGELCVGTMREVWEEELRGTTVREDCDGGL